MTQHRQYEVREITPGGRDGRVWEVRVLPESISYQVTATGRALTETPPGRQPHDGDWSEEEILAGIRHAIEKDLASPPEKIAGDSYAVRGTSSDLYDANGL